MKNKQGQQSLQAELSSMFQNYNENRQTYKDRNIKTISMLVKPTNNYTALLENYKSEFAYKYIFPIQESKATVFTGADNTLDYNIYNKKIYESLTKIIKKDLDKIIKY